MKLWWKLFLAAALAPALCSAEPAPGFHRVGRVDLPGAGRGDFLSLDASARRLYVTHGNQVQVLDADSLKLVGVVTGVPHAHGVALVPGLGKGYASSGDPGSVVVFDLKTLKRLGEIPSPPDTDVILFDAPSGRVLTFNGGSHNATAIDPRSDRVIQTLDLGGDPEMAVADGQGGLYDDVESSSEVIRIDAKTLKIEKRWPVAPGVKPSGLALDGAHQRLFIGCRNKLMVVMDASNGKVIQSLPIGDHVDTTVYDPGTQSILSSCGDGTLSVVRQDSPDHYSVTENAVSEPGAKTMALDAKSGRVFLSTAHAAGEDAAAFHVLVMGR